MHEASERSEGKYFPAAEDKMAVARQLEDQIAQRVGWSKGRTRYSNHPMVMLPGGHDCIVPAAEQLFDFIHAEVLVQIGDLCKLRVTGSLPEHRPGAERVLTHDFGEILCTVRLPKRVEESQDGKLTIRAIGGISGVILLAVILALGEHVSGFFDRGNSGPSIDTKPSDTQAAPLDVGHGGDDPAKNVHLNSFAVDTIKQFP